MSISLSLCHSLSLSLSLSPSLPLSPSLSLSLLPSYSRTHKHTYALTHNAHTHAHNRHRTHTPSLMYSYVEADVIAFEECTQHADRGHVVVLGCRWPAPLRHLSGCHCISTVDWCHCCRSREKRLGWYKSGEYCDPRPVKLWEALPNTNHLSHQLLWPTIVMVSSFIIRPYTGDGNNNIASSHLRRKHITFKV